MQSEIRGYAKGLVRTILVMPFSPKQFTMHVLLVQLKLARALLY
jgi:hypothetical protein